MGRHESADPQARRADAWAPRRAGVATDGGPSLPGYRDFVPVARSEGSEVYRAYQDGVDRPVAVKVLLLLDDPAAVARFHRELEITVQLGRQHPHIVTVIDTGTTSDGRPCIVMEHYDRGSLHDRLRSGGPLPWDEVLAAGTVVADALSFAHRHGVLHRDVKPQNILVLPTSYVVADFGIARRIGAARTSSVEWFSFPHAAPQVLDGDPPAVADDIWSVGSTMFTLLDGQPPFAVGRADEDTALAYMKRVRTGNRRALNRQDIPAGLVAIIDRCMQQERADRFPDAEALHAALTELGADTRAWAPAPPGAPVSPNAAVPPGAAMSPSVGGGRTGGVSARSTGPVAEGPLVVPVQPAVQTPRPAPPLAATTMPPPHLSIAPPQGAPTATPQAAFTAPPQAAPTAPPPAAFTAPPAAGPTTPPGSQVIPPSPVVGAATMQRQLGALAPSALAQGVGAQVAAGGYVVGDETVRPDYGQPPSTAPGVSAPAPARSLRRILVGTLVALLIGGVLGIGGTWVAGLIRDDTNESRQGQTPTNGSSLDPAGAGGPSPTKLSRVNPEIAPELTDVTATDRSVVRLRWKDKSGGKAKFVVVRVFESSSETSSYVVPERDTEYEVRGLDPSTAPYCFHVIAVTTDENGRSDRRCVSPPPS